MLPGPGGTGLITLPSTRNRSRGRRSRPSRSLEEDVEAASQTDVEAAEASQDEQIGTPRKTSTSGSAPSLADVESASQTDVEAASQTDVETHSSSIDPLEDREVALSATEQIMAQRWQCDLCFELHSYHETLWRLNDECCEHTFCRRCVRGSVQWGGRCPYDNTPIPPIIICGTMGTEEYVYHEKHAEARRIGGIMCAVVDCPGVAPGHAGATRQAVECQICGAQHCGRRVCGAPWTRGHRCWDVIDAERRSAEQDLQMQWRHGGRESLYLATKQRLNRGPRFRPCPNCGVMVEHVGGCNMIYHDSCRTRWCFVCRRIGTCNDFDCRTPGSGPPTPRLSVSVSATPVPRKPRTPSLVIIIVVVVMIIMVCNACFRSLTKFPRSDFLDTSVEDETVTSRATAPPSSTCERGSCTSTLPAEPAVSLALPPLHIESAEQNEAAVKMLEESHIQFDVEAALGRLPKTFVQTLEDPPARFFTVPEAIHVGPIVHNATGITRINRKRRSPRSNVRYENRWCFV